MAQGSTIMPMFDPHFNQTVLAVTINSTFTVSNFFPMLFLDENIMKYLNPYNSPNVKPYMSNGQYWVLLTINRGWSSNG